MIFCLVQPFLQAIFLFNLLNCTVFIKIPSKRIKFSLLGSAYHEQPYLKIFYYFLNFFIGPYTFTLDAPVQSLFAIFYLKSIKRVNGYQEIASIYIVLQDLVIIVIRY